MVKDSLFYEQIVEGNSGEGSEENGGTVNENLIVCGAK